MIRALVVAAAVVLAPIAARAQTLTVTNAEGKVTTFTAETLAALPRAEASLRRGGKAVVYEGVTLAAILREAGVPQGPRLHGKPLSTTVLVQGADGYRAAFGLAETDPSVRTSAIVLADRKAGGALADGEGPWRLVVDADQRPERAVKGVAAIKVVPAAD